MLVADYTRSTVSLRSIDLDYATDGCRSGSRRYWRRTDVRNLYEDLVVYPDVRSDDPIAHTLKKYQRRTRATFQRRCAPLQQSGPGEDARASPIKLLAQSGRILTTTLLQRGSVSGLVYERDRYGIANQVGF